MPVLSKSLRDRISTLKASQPVRSKEPLWHGPCDPGPNGGITFSMLNRFLTCRERFRLYSMDGLSGVEQFNPRMDYGNFWHLCEELLAAGEWSIGRGTEVLKKYAIELSDKFPNQQEDVYKWYRVCLTQFPLYVDWWKDHPDIIARKPIWSEETFCVPYEIGKDKAGKPIIVYLRGKFDSVDLVNRKGAAILSVHENKTKSDINLEQILKQLTWDLQTLIYITALLYFIRNRPNKALTDKRHLEGWNTLWNNQGAALEVRYNVVRRPLGGGRGSITKSEGTKGAKCPKCKATGNVKGERCPKCNGHCRINAKPAETWDQYFDRLREIIKGAVEPNGDHYFFSRFNTPISLGEIEKFQEETLNPILRNLVQWYAHVSGSMKDNRSPFEDQSIHWRHPMGVTNWLNEGYGSDYENYLNTGSEIGLQPARLFRELAPPPSIIKA